MFAHLRERRAAATAEAQDRVGCLAGVQLTMPSVKRGCVGSHQQPLLTRLNASILFFFVALSSELALWYEQSSKYDFQKQTLCLQKPKTWCKNRYLKIVAWFIII